jgi:hypothetical protein
MICLLQRRFIVTATAAIGGFGVITPGQAGEDSSESGFFSFSPAKNAEVIVKVLDGRALKQLLLGGRDPDDGRLVHGDRERHPDRPHQVVREPDRRAIGDDHRHDRLLGVSLSQAGVPPMPGAEVDAR